jgi:hypothetical protein
VGVVEALAHRSIQVRRLLERASTWPSAAQGNAACLPGTHYRTARQLRPVEVDELVQGYEAGATVFQLGDRFGIDRRTVGKHLRARGIDTTPPGLRPDDIPRAAELYRAGWSLARISREFDTTHMTVRARLLEAGVVMRTPWERGLAG